MKFVTMITRSGIARAMASALVLAVLATSTGLTLADWGPSKFDLHVRVFNGDVMRDIKVSGADLLLVADDRSNPDHGVRGTTDGSGNYLFHVNEGNYNLEIRHPDFYGRDYRITLDGTTEVDANLIPLETPTGPNPQPPSGGGCLPTPPRGQPMLNIWPISTSGEACTDYPLIMARNVTRDTGYVHNSTVQTSANDVIRFQLYVHNGVLDFDDNIARNVMVKANINTSSSSASIAAEAWADNAARINSAQKGGNITVDYSSGETLEFISGSAKVYSRGPNLMGDFSNSVVSGGASLGDMRGCYDFLRFVTFEMRVKGSTPVTPPVQDAKLTIVKEVINDNGGTAQPRDFVLTVGGKTLRSGDTVTLAPGNYNVSEQNHSGYTKVNVRGACDGNGDVSLSAGDNKTCVIVNNDNAPQGPTTAKLTLIKEVVNNNGGTAKPGDFVLRVGNHSIRSGQSVTLNPGDYVVSEDTFSGYTKTGIRGACAGTGAITLKAGDDKTCVITNDDVAPTVNPTISIEKVVRNVSDNQSSFVNSTNADFGEQVEFQIRVSVTGTVHNITVTDVLPNRLTYVNNSLRLEGVAAGNSNSVVIGTMTSTAKNITLRATVADASAFSEGSTTIVNTASVTSSAGSASDSANVVVNKATTPSNTTLKIEKTVKNFTTNTGYGEIVDARKDEVVEFRIVVTNTGSITANNVRLQDALPSNLSFISGSITIDGSNNSSDIFSNQAALGNLNPGQSKTVIFRAKAPSTITSHNTVTNTATATASNTGSVSDSAQVTLVPVLGGNVNLVLSKKAYNQTQAKDATTVTAHPGDIIVYTLTTKNTGSADAQNYVVEDNIADILQLADLISFVGSNYDAANKKLVWPAQTILAGGHIEKTFSVKVKSPIPSGTDHIMTNIYGNEVRVNVVRPYVAPATGTASTISFILALMSVGGFFFYRKYRATKLVDVVS